MTTRRGGVHRKACPFACPSQRLDGGETANETDLLLEVVIIPRDHVAPIVPKNWPFFHIVGFGYASIELLEAIREYITAFHLCQVDDISIEAAHV